MPKTADKSTTKRFSWTLLGLFPPPFLPMHSMHPGCLWVALLPIGALISLRKLSRPRGECKWVDVVHQGCSNLEGIKRELITYGDIISCTRARGGQSLFQKDVLHMPFLRCLERWVTSLTRCPFFFSGNCASASFLAPLSGR